MTMDTSILRSEVGRRHFIKACSLASFAAVSVVDLAEKPIPRVIKTWTKKSSW